MPRPISRRTLNSSGILSRQAATSLDQFPYVQGSRPGIVSVQRISERFLGAESRGSPLPFGISNEPDIEQISRIFPALPVNE